MLLSYRDPDFWPAFIRKHWRPRRPTVLRQPFRDFPFHEDSVLHGMRAFQAGLRSGDEKFRYLLSFDGATGRHRKVLRAFLGRESRSMAALEQHYRDTFREKPFGLMVNNLQSIEPAIWRGVAAFLQDAQAWVDYPVARTVIDLFYGNYAASFLGLHKDTQEIFAFVVRGEKTILAWPFDYFVERVPGLSPAARLFQTDLPVDYRRFRKDALVLHARPGDVIYWPSDYWHIAEGRPGQFATMLSLGLFLPQTVDPRTAAELSAFRERMLGRQGLRSGDMSAVAEGMEGARRLQWATGFGFRFGAPAKAEFPQLARTAGPIAKAPTTLLLWMREPGRRLRIASNGYALVLPQSARLIAALESLSRGEMVTAKAAVPCPPIPILLTYWDTAGEPALKTARLKRDPVSLLLSWLHAVGGGNPSHP